MALVTGGARRIGRAVALALAHAGYDLAITYHTSRAQADDTVRAVTALGRRALAVHADFARPAAVTAVRRAILRRYGRLDALILNAAIFQPSPADAPHTQLAASFDRHMAVNARAPMLLTLALRDLLAASRCELQGPGGRVVAFIDAHVLAQPMQRFCAYNASKAALAQLCRSLALELAPDITLNMIAPGALAWAEGLSHAFRKRYLARVPLGRIGRPDDAAKAVLYLLRDAPYCTGQIIALDGGRLLT